MLADAELRALAAMSDSAVFSEVIFGFHAQQIAEKSLKAWLSGIGAEYPKTHDLGLLLTRLAEHDQDTQGLEELMEYNAFAVQLRYEAFDDLGEPLPRGDTIAIMQQLVDRVRADLGLS